MVENNPQVQPFVLRPSDLALIREVCGAHEPVVKMRPSERAMEVSSTRDLAQKFAEKVCPAITLFEWGLVTHALACRFKRARQERERYLTLFRWIRGRLRADSLAAPVLAKWEQIEKLNKQEVLARAGAEIDRLRRQKDLARGASFGHRPRTRKSH